MEEYIYKDNKKLRYGYTTGSCAAAASKAAAMMLLTKIRQENIFLMTPKGIGLNLKVENIQINDEEVTCGIIKDAGDDADCTDGILVLATVRATDNNEIIITGGKGVGRVTKPGLEQPVGEAAINRVPRQMIKEAVSDVIETCSFSGGMHIEISVPKGEEIGARTFNPRLGIEGGISILGTSGIVEPMSEQALVATIHTEMKQKAHGGVKNILVTPGNYGRDFAKKEFGIDLDMGIKCSNFIGETIDMAYEFQLEKILLIGHIGKLVKVAAGIMNTHSRWADGRMEVLCAGAVMAGAQTDLCKKILECITTDDALQLLSDNNLLEKTMQYVMKKIYENLNRRAYEGLTVEVIVFSNVFGVLGMTNKAEKLLDYFR